jgi:phosphate:Na+ symporter
LGSGIRENSWSTGNSREFRYVQPIVLVLKKHCANVGTTITGWILVLNIGKYGLPILGLAAFFYLFTKGDRWRYSAMSIMGIGMVFFGLELMKDACGVIKDLPEFEAWFQRFQADSYWGVLKCAAAGCILTTIVQSSSATLGITISLAYQGIISYETAAALVLGENVGTTITAFLASLGATTNARRAAYFHVIFNLFGVFWITLIFAQYVDFIQWLTVQPVNEAVVDGDITTYPNTTAAIAATHSIFNIANTLLFIPFVPLLVRFLNWAVPAKDFIEKPRLTDLDIRILETPSLAIEQSRKEIARMSDSCAKMLNWLAELMTQDDPDKQLGDELKRNEQILDTMQDEVSVFVTNLLSGNIPHSLADEARRQLRMADEYESMSDYIANLDKFDRKLRRESLRFTPNQIEDLSKLNRQLGNYLAEINLAFQQEDRGVLKRTETTSRRIRDQIKQIRRTHLEDLSGGSIAPQVNVAFLAAMNAYGRVHDHIHNVAELISGEK